MVAVMPGLRRHWAGIQPSVWRGVYLVSVFAFLLPFVTVKGCSSSTVTTYRGVDLLTLYAGWLYLVPILSALALFVLSFYRRNENLIHRGLRESFALILSGMSGVISIPICLALYFLVEGLRCQERWAVRWAPVTALLAGTVIGVLPQIAFPSARWASTVVLVCLVGLAILGAVRASARHDQRLSAISPRA